MHSIFFFQGTTTLSRKNCPERAANYETRISVHCGDIQCIVLWVFAQTYLATLYRFSLQRFFLSSYKRSVKQFVAYSFSRAP